MPKGNSYDSIPGGLQGTEEFIIFTSTDTYNCTLDEVITFIQSENVFEPANDNIQSHISSTSNPHSVTKEQLGLNNVTNVNTTDPTNIIWTSSNRTVTDTQINAWNAKQDALGFTPENVANKSNDISTDRSSTTKYPSVKAFADYVDTLATGSMKRCGLWDASSNTFPATGGSGTGGAVKANDFWIISVAGSPGGHAIQIGDFIIANIDTPGQTDTNWDKLNTNISYAPEDSANKVTSISGSSTNTQYPSAKLLYDQLVLKANLSGAAFTGDISSTGKYTGRIGRNIQTVTNTTIFTHNCENYQGGKITAQSGDLTMANPTGTAMDGEQFIMRIKSTGGGSRTITWGSDFANCGGFMTTTTVDGKWHTIGFIYSTTDSKWYCVSSILQP